MTHWNDYNDAEDQNQYDVIPKGTIAKVRMTIKPGTYNDPDQGWVDDWASRSETGSVYLQGEFVVLEGPYAKRKVWSLIGLYSPKGPNWGKMGRSFIKGILNSAYQLDPKDISPAAQAKRQINSFADLDGIEFLARIDIGEGPHGEDKNEINYVITSDKKEYATYMATALPASQQAGQPYTPPTSAVQNTAPQKSLPKASWLNQNT
ncbi:MAG: hypothetical protein ACTSXQ_06245 [Alphaproteobacteria bacterium]